MYIYITNTGEFLIVVKLEEKYICFFTHSVTQISKQATNYSKQVRNKVRENKPKYLYLGTFKIERYI